MDLLIELKKLNPSFLEFIHQNIVAENGDILGSRYYGINENGDSFSGGTSSDKEIALRIAVAESFERSLFYIIANDEKLKKEFEIIKFPSSSGFAAGFEDCSTRFRAICESVERWAWSKWIDEHFEILEEVPNQKLSKLTNHLMNDFIDFKWLRKEFQIEVSSTETMKLTLVIFLGLTEDGIFPGSRVSTNFDDLYEHPVIEAHRNLINFKINHENSNSAGDIIEQRSMFFGKNKKIAINQIKKAIKKDWPNPSIFLLKKFETNIHEVFLYRCLLNDFVGWHEGARDRFVY